MAMRSEFLKLWSQLYPMGRSLASSESLVNGHLIAISAVVEDSADMCHDTAPEKCVGNLKPVFLK